MSLGGTDVAPEPSMGRSRVTFISSPAATRIWGLIVIVLSWAGAAQAATLTLAWDPSPEPDTAGYVLNWGNHSGVYESGIDVGNQTSTQLTGLVAGLPYYFVVRAYNSAGLYSSPSVEVSRRVGIPYSVPGDFFGDFQSDTTVFRPSNGTWYIRESNAIEAYVW